MRSMRRTTSRRTTAGRTLAAATVLLLATALVGCSTQDDADDGTGSEDSNGSETAGQPEVGPSTRAVDWLSGELTDGLVHNRADDFDDYGLTADVAMAFATTGDQQSAEEVWARLAEEVDGYTTGADFGQPKDVYAGSVAKLLTLTEVVGADPSDIGGVDLVGRAEATVSDSGPSTGRIEDSGKQDYANVLGQAYAVRGLLAVDSPRGDEALDYLLRQQCSDGYFRLDFTPDKGAQDQTCDGGTKRQSPADPDVTAVALLSLAASGTGDEDAQAAIDSATQWLAGQQGDDGGFRGGISTPTVNANSTALGGWALAAADRCDEAATAAAWLEAQQLTEDTGPSGIAEVGAVAYDRAALRKADRKGITVATQDQFRRATAQAAPALMALTAEGCRTL